MRRPVAGLAALAALAVLVLLLASGDLDLGDGPAGVGAGEGDANGLAHSPELKGGAEDPPQGQGGDSKVAPPSAGSSALLVTVRDMRDGRPLGEFAVYLVALSERELRGRHRRREYREARPQMEVRASRPASQETTDDSGVLRLRSRGAVRQLILVPAHASWYALNPDTWHRDRALWVCKMLDVHARVTGLDADLAPKSARVGIRADLSTASRSGSSGATPGRLRATAVKLASELRVQRRRSTGDGTGRDALVAPRITGVAAVAWSDGFRPALELLETAGEADVLHVEIGLETATVLTGVVSAAGQGPLTSSPRLEVRILIRQRGRREPDATPAELSLLCGRGWSARRLGREPDAPWYCRTDAKVDRRTGAFRVDLPFAGEVGVRCSATGYSTLDESLGSIGTGERRLRLVLRPETVADQARVPITRKDAKRLGYSGRVWLTEMDGDLVVRVIPVDVDQEHGIRTADLKRGMRYVLTSGPATGKKHGTFTWLGQATIEVR